MTSFVYIMSASHSGSTLLTLLLASHPDVCSVGETVAVLATGDEDTGLCSCGARMDQCPFWRRVRETLASRGFHWGSLSFQTRFRMKENKFVDRILRAEYKGAFLETVRDVLLSGSPSWRARKAIIAASNMALVETVTQLSKARVFLDSSKEPHHLKYLLRIPSFETKVIHMVRDGRGVAASYVRRNEMPMDRATDEWRRSIISEEHLLRRLAADQYTRLRYEDLCRNVEEAVGPVLRFMGLDPEKWNRDFRSESQHILGNRMRLDRSGEIRLDERWRTTLTQDDLDVFTRMAGQLNRRYGYEP